MKNIILILYFIFIPLFSFCRLLSDFSIFPIACYANGAYNTFWHTDLCILNVNNYNIEVKIEFWSNDGNFYASENISVDSLGNKCIENVIYEIFKYEGYGILVLTTEGDLMDSWIKIYTKREDGGSYGQSLANQRFDSIVKNSYLYGLKKNGFFKTNIGIATYYFSSDFDVELYDVYGNLKKTYNIKVPQNGVVQFPIDIDIENGFAKIYPIVK